MMTNITILYDEAIELDCGIKIWGSPYSPEFMGWAFSLKTPKDSVDLWQQIPDDTDILMTHGPPHGIQDECSNGFHAGDAALLKEVKERVKPKYHLFGHIHEAYGATVIGPTTFINASICTLKYYPTQKPFVFDFRVPMIGGIPEKKLAKQLKDSQIDLDSFSEKLSEDEKERLNKLIEAN